MPLPPPEIAGWTCSVCGDLHTNPLRDIRFGLPEPVFELSEEDRAERATVTDDACLFVDDHGDVRYYVRGLIHLPIREIDDYFRFGIWLEVSGPDYVRLGELWHDENGFESPPFHGRLANDVPPYEGTLDLEVSLQLREVSILPAVILLETRHPLTVDQRDGIDPEQAQRLAESVLHR